MASVTVHVLGNDSSQLWPSTDHTCISSVVSVQHGRVHV